MSSESPVVEIYSSDGYELSVKNGIAIPTGTRGILLAGSDGSNSRFVLIDGSNRLITAGAGVAGSPAGGVLTVQGVTGGTVLPISGTVTANQGTANTLANAWSSKITDAINGPVAVKPASTAVVATDPALVVAISPNNSIAITSTGTSDVTATGALGALNATVQITLAGHSSVGFQLATGTLIGTIVAEMSFDGGTTWNATYFDQTTGSKVSSVTFSSSNTALGSTIVGVGGSGLARVRVSAYTSGTANITLRASMLEDPSQLYAGLSGSTALPPTAVKIAGVYNNTTLQTISVDSQGRIITSPPSSISSLSGFSNGYVALAVNTKSFVGATTYIEQTTGAQRSISSSSVSDTGAGTGAQQVTIIWFDSTGAGPNSEIVTLSGTANVNTVSTTMCYIESIIVSRVGSGGSNAGTITLHAAAAGGGAAIGTIVIGDNQTFWCHHYVPTGKTCYITGICAGANNNAGATFTTTARFIGVTGAVENQISDFIRNGGGGNASQPSFTRTYGTPLQVAGPARINGYVNPDQATSSSYWLSFDFYQQ